MKEYYRGNTVGTEIIVCFLVVITNILMKKIRLSKCISIILDESIDVNAKVN